MSRSFPIVTAAALAALLAGCAGAPDRPSFGERLLSEGGETSRLGRDWAEGAEAVAEGRALIEEGRDEIEEGEDLMSSGRRKVRRGESLVEEGERAQEVAETDYRRLSRSAGG